MLWSAYVRRPLGFDLSYKRLREMLERHGIEPRCSASQTLPLPQRTRTRSSDTKHRCCDVNFNPGSSHQDIYNYEAEHRERQDTNAVSTVQASNSDGVFVQLGDTVTIAVRTSTTRSNWLSNSPPDPSKNETRCQRFCLPAPHGSTGGVTFNTTVPITATHTHALFQRGLQETTSPY